MASTKEYRDFILERLQGNITSRAMMGEYLLYRDGILFGGIYDNRLLVKITGENKKYNMPEQLPYDGAKMMYMPSDLDNKALIEEIVLTACEDLKKK